MFKVTGLDKLKGIVNNLSNQLEDRTLQGIYVSAYEIRDIWKEKAVEVNLDTEYIDSIDVIERVDGAYVGPTKVLVKTPTGIIDFEKARVGEVVSSVVRCPINKYYREVKRRYKREEVEQYEIPNIVRDNLDVFKNIIRKNIRENILELIR